MKSFFPISTIVVYSLLIFSIGIRAEENLDSTSLYSVYTLSDKTTAIVSNMSDDGYIFSQFDEIFIQIDEKEKLRESFFNLIYENKTSSNIIPYDTAGIYNLLHNKELESRIKPLLKKEFYIYGTKGMEIKSVNKIILGLDECKTNIYVFTIDKFDVKKNGHPVLATDKKLNIIYNKDFKEVEDKINTFYNKMESDYSDNTTTKVFANLGSLYFTYTDDFEWAKNYKDENINCLFPSRGIFKLQEDNTVIPIWQDGLDLYGIPCD